MKKEDIWKIYDSDYADSYNERYLTNPFSQLSLDVELNVLKNLIGKNDRWLDIGCGTGYFLSKFPGIQRAGLDISPEMLARAKAVNPDILFLKEGDFREKISEWDQAWSVISCMWGAYIYADSVREVEQIITNMINWTKPGGSIFLPVIDMEDIRPNQQITYDQYTDVYGGNIAVTSFTWTWTEADSKKVHKHLVSPHIEHFIKLLSPYFDMIEVVRYPPYQTGWVSRKAILAKRRRMAPLADQPAQVTWHSIPSAVHPSDSQYPPSPATFLSHRQLLAELVSRVKSGALLQSLKRKFLR